MRFITIPKDVYGDIPEGAPPDFEPRPVSFSSLVRNILPQDDRTTEDLAKITKFEELMDGVRNLKPGDIWELNEANWEFLSILARTFRTAAGGSYHPTLKPALFPFFRAIAGASQKDPRIVEEKEPAKAEPKAEAA